MSAHAASTTDVALIGYGPTGAVLANLLGRRGWNVDVFERSPEPLNAPRAVHFDAEAMRVFQQLGVADALLAKVLPIRGMHFLGGAGQVIFQFDAEAADQPLGWPQGFMFHQPDLERALRDAAQRYSNVIPHLGHDVQRVSATEDGAGAVIDVSGPNGRRTVHARYVVGCCGARSITRAAIGSGVIDYGFNQEWLVLDLVLQRPLDLPQVTVQYCDPSRPSTYVVMPGHRRRFEFMVMPGESADTLLEPATMTHLLRRWLQPGEYVIERAAVYAFHALVAERWRAGPLLIAGDAAHQMPPFLGQGLCAGVRDAANLAWKLNLVLSGTASDSLLDTYQSERMPHVQATVEDDILLGSIIQTTVPERARQRDTKATSTGAPTPLTPRTYVIGDGLSAIDATARTPFPQPTLPHGQRYDDVLGDHFALVGPVTPSENASAILAALGARIIRDPAPAIEEWGTLRNARAVLVRPDRVVMGLISDPTGLDGALLPLAGYLQFPRPGR
jgi:3-(3-hydroxy-phenyl)propionate hydroxylase